MLMTNSLPVADKVLMFYRQQEKSAFHKDFLANDYIQEIIFFHRLKDYIRDKNFSFEKLQDVISYRTYRVILSMLKKGYIEESLKAIENYKLSLEYFVRQDYAKLNDRLRCKVLLQENKFLLKIIGRI